MCYNDDLIVSLELFKIKMDVSHTFIQCVCARVCVYKLLYYTHTHTHTPVTTDDI